MRMSDRANNDQLQPEHAAALCQTDFIVGSYLSAVTFIIRDTSRDPRYFDSHLLS